MGTTKRKRYVPRGVNGFPRDAMLRRRVDVVCKHHDSWTSSSRAHISSSPRDDAFSKKKKKKKKRTETCRCRRRRRRRRCERDGFSRRRQEKRRVVEERAKRIRRLARRK